MCTAYGYDAVSRLTGLTLGPSGTGTTITLGNYSPAGQIGSRTNSNDAFAWTGGVNVNRGYAANGLNQYTQTGAIVPTYDPKGNLTSAGSPIYSFNAESDLGTLKVGSVTHYYYVDALRRMVFNNGDNARFEYDGSSLAAEYTTSGTLLRRYVSGPGDDEPLVWYEGTGTSDKRFLVADERGSIVWVRNASGGTIAVNAYDEYGIPASTNQGRFQYTGQQWIPDIGMYYYKARFYSPTLGRFLQTDPIGYADGPNWYNYVQSDPINRIDPTGLAGCPPPRPNEVVVCLILPQPDLVGPVIRQGGNNGGVITTRSPAPNRPKLTPERTQCGRGAGAAQVSSATGNAGVANDALKPGVTAGEKAAFEKGGYVLSAISSVATFVSSLQQGEPIDVAYMRATSPLVTGAMGAAAGAFVGGAAGGAAGSVVPLVGNAAGAAAGAVTGLVAGAVVGEKLGEMSAEEYAKARGHGGC